jgi:xylulokinase
MEPTMAEKYILTHDLGTSSNKAVLFTVHGDVIGESRQEYSLYYPQPGYAEQDAYDWWRAVCETTHSLLQKTGIPPQDIVGITFASQMQTVVAVDQAGKPVMPAISWLDTRAADVMREKLWTWPRVQGYNIFKLLKFLTITGGAPGHAGKDPLGKILWLKEYRPDLFAATHKFLDAKDFIVYQMTDLFVKSADMAVVWWLLDTRNNKNQWHAGLCRLAGVDVDKLPEIRESAAIVGRLSAKAAEKLGLVKGTPVINGAGDISSAALGSGAIDEGELNIRLGTSGGISGHFRKRKIDIPHYTGCIGSTWPDEYYLALAHQETVGICLEWLRNNIVYHEQYLKKEMHVDGIFQLLDQLAELAPAGADGLVFTPWMYGERAPLNDQYVRSGLFNLGLNHTREHIIRAFFEGVAYNMRWAMETVEKLYWKVDHLHAIGGGAKSRVWCQIIADVTNRTILQVEEPQLANAKGVALLASLALGYIEKFNDIKKHIRVQEQFQPDPHNRKVYDKQFAEFQALYRQNKRWYKRMNS